MSSPFHEIAVDEDLTIHVRAPSLPRHAELISVNGVPALTIATHAQEQSPQTWKEFLNAMLPVIMRAADAPLQDTARVCVKDRHGCVTDVSLPCPIDTTVDSLAAMKQQYAAIINLARLSGLNDSDISCVFTATLSQLGAGAPGGAIPTEMMEGVQGMAQQMAGGMGQGGQCQQQ